MTLTIKKKTNVLIFVKIAMASELWEIQRNGFKTRIKHKFKFHFNLIKKGMCNFLQNYIYRQR